MSLPIDPISSQQTLLGLVVFIRVFWPNRGFLLSLSNVAGRGEGGLGELSATLLLRL